MWLESVKKDLLSPLYRGQVVRKCSDLSFKSSESIQFCNAKAMQKKCTPAKGHLNALYAMLPGVCLVSKLLAFCIFESCVEIA